MNQQILFNDDMAYDSINQAWFFTGLLSGEQVTITIRVNDGEELTEALKFDFECQVEEWLEDNEPPMNRNIELVYK